MPKGKRHSAQLKLKVALEAAKGSKTLSGLASEYSLHPSQIGDWKGQLLDEGPAIFSPTTTRGQREQETLQSGLYEQIGRLKMELEWLKGRLPHELPANTSASTTRSARIRAYATRLPHRCISDAPAARQRHRSFISLGHFVVLTLGPSSASHPSFSPLGEEQG